ncbi:hypothetical protein GOBAR_AA06055 [Gossypium barbadense]|uniref:Uncharacterized protein n=1 Tax=Gossypium barbadense TaxID=3634 RepID=A0A2P5YG08_GOSBA|nr:hypothetical protein GOBAR_AA06055 [Gossypium barbadense]
METLEGGCSEASRSKDQSIKKVHFKEIDRDPNVVMVVDLDQVPSLSWKERLMGKNPRVVGRELEAIDFDDEKDFVLIEGDVIRSFINGIPLINFSKRANQFLIKDMAYTMVVKLLGRGPWIIYGQYLTIQPWTMDFDPTQPYPSVVMSWIHLPGFRNPNGEAWSSVEEKLAGSGFGLKWCKAFKGDQDF